MDLSHPQWLWFLCALPLLWLLARPLRPRHSVATPYLELWHRALARVRRRPIRVRWLRLLLLVLAFVATTLAFSGARLGHREGPTRLVALLDASGSMAARGGATGSKSAWHVARKALADRLAGLSAEVQVTLGVAGVELFVRELDAERDLSWLPDEPSRGQGVDLAELAAAVATPECAVWTLTDGIAPTRVPKQGALSLFGAVGDNLGITSCTVSDGWPLPDLKVVLDVQNASAETQRTTLSASGGALLAAPQALELAPRATERVTLALRRGQGGAVRIALAVFDLLPADDAVELRVPPPAAPDIALLADVEDPYLLEQAAKSLAAETGGRVVSERERAGLLLIEGGALPAAAVRARMITFGTRFSSVEVAAADLVARPRVVDWERTSPLLRDLDLSELFVGRCLTRGFGEPGESLIATEGGPLAVVRRHEGGASVHFAFALGESNLGLLAAFPSLLRRSFAACYGQAAAAQGPPPGHFDALESDLRARAPGAAERPLPAFGSAGASLVVPLLLLALGSMVLRIYC